MSWNPTRLILLTATLLLMTEQIQHAAPPPATSGYDRPYGPRRQSRSQTIAKNGMVATSHPLAAQAGLDILRSGGSAVDAAIAANAMLGVVEPMSCGIGGDLFAIYWDNKTQKLYGLNASGRSPRALNRKVFADKGLRSIPIEGPLCWSTPGCVRGWDDLRKKFGNKELAEILAPAINTADEGFPIAEIISGYWRSATNSLQAHQDAAETFLVDGKRAPGNGELFRNPRLAATYRQLAENGADAFYTGEIAEKIVRFSQQNGGYFSPVDLAKHESQWVEPVSSNYRGYDIWELPPNGQGIAALQILNVLEQHDLSKLSNTHPDYLHLFIEAKKLAFADRAKFYADSDFEKLPTATLISKAYATQQAKRIDRQKAAEDVPAGDPILQHGDTVYITVVDKDRNCCSLIQSNYYGFGSKMIPGDLGFALQNRGALFSLDENHLNTLEPGKRPFHTIIPAMVTKDGQPQFCFGVMGGDMQPQGHAQVLVNWIDFGMNVQEAGDAARVRHLGSAQPTGQAAQGVGNVMVESGISDVVVDELKSRGHRVTRGRGGFGGYQGILIDWKNGVLRGATEPRKDGVAIGY